MRKAAERNEVARAEPKDGAAKVFYKRFTACEKERVQEERGGARENGEIRNNIVPRRDPSGKLPGGAPPAAFLETKRKLEETGGDWFQPVARRGGCAGRRSALSLKRATPRGLANEISFRERRNPGIVT